jgi:DNA-directed RNA polymerase specialized sigma24 family protein
MTYEAIGKQLGISDEAVRQRVQKIKQKLESKARKMGLEEYLHGTN